MRGFLALCGAVGVLLGGLMAFTTASYVALGVVVVSGGVVLIAAAAFLDGVRVWPAVGGAVVAAAGTALGLGATRTEICCMFAVTEKRGYPFGWLRRSAEYLELPVRVPPSFADDAAWTVDTPYLLADLAVWGVLGLVLMVGLSVAAGKTGRVGLQRIRQGSFLDSGNA